MYVYVNGIQDNMTIDLFNPIYPIYQSTRNLLIGDKKMVLVI